jgi:hypothetical protein
LTVRCCLAGDDVVEMADGKAFNSMRRRHASFKPLDSIWREYEVEVKRSILKLNKILPAFDLRGLLGDRSNPNSTSALARARPFSGERSGKTSASCVVSANPKRIARTFR